MNRKTYSETQQRFSIRKFKSGRSDSILIGALALLMLGGSYTLTALPTSTVYAAEIEATITDTSEPDSDRYAGSFSIPGEAALSDNGVTVNGNKTTVKNDGGETVLDSNKIKAVGTEAANAERLYKAGEYAKDPQTAGSESSERDLTVDYKFVVDGTDELIKEENDVATGVTETVVANYVTEGEFGKKYTGVDITRNQPFDKEAKGEQILSHNGKTYLRVGEAEETTKKYYTEVGGIAAAATPDGLYDENGEVKYDALEAGQTVWIVQEDKDGYGKYVKATVPAGATNDWLSKTFQDNIVNAKAYTPENVAADGDVQDGDYLMVVEENMYATYYSAKDYKAYEPNTFVVMPSTVKTLEDAMRTFYALNNLSQFDVASYEEWTSPQFKNEFLKDITKPVDPKGFINEIYPTAAVMEVKVDAQGRPLESTSRVGKNIGFKYRSTISDAYRLHDEGGRISDYGEEGYDQHEKIKVSTGMVETTGGVETVKNIYTYFTAITPNRAFRIAKPTTPDTVVTYRYRELLEETTEVKGSVVIKYQTLDGTELQKDFEDTAETVVARSTTKYYTKPDGTKQYVNAAGQPQEEPNAPEPVEVPYNATENNEKPTIIEKDGVTYKLVEEPQNQTGVVVEGVTTVVYKYAPVYKVTHEFVSGTPGKDLPEAIKALTPADQPKDKVDTATITPTNDFSKTPVEDAENDGVWTFTSWDKDTDTINKADGKFVGTWVFTPNTYKVTHEFVSGTPGKDLPEAIKALTPADQPKDKENTASIAPTNDFPRTPVEDKENDGVWTFTSWDKDTDTINKADGKFVGTWVFTPNTYKVTHEFVSGTPGKDLPEAIKALTPADQPKDKVDTATITPTNDFSKTPVEDAENDGVWTFTSWDKDTDTINKADGKFVGTWVFTPNTYKVTHEFVSGTPGKDLPEAIKALTPADQPKDKVDTATITPTNDFSKTPVEDAENDGVWTFTSWDKDTDTINKADGKFVGTWVFTPNTYKVTHEFVSGTPGKDLPEAIKALTPADQPKDKENTASIAPTNDFPRTPVEDKENDGVWTFTSWDKDTDTINKADGKFVGTWVFTPNPKEETPGKPEETTPGKPEETTPGKPEETTPGKPEETTPGKPEEETPGKPEETTPGKPEETTPGKPEEETPGKPEETTPGKPEEETPGKPEETTPGKPEETTPGKPEETTPGKPEEETPGKPEETTPGKPEETTPGKPEETTPGKPEEETPGKPEETTPGKPEEETPGKPEETTPGKPEETTPGKPEEETPGKPGEETPGKPGEETPGKPGEETPGKPGEETPGKPGEETPGKPGEETPGKPGEETPGKPGEETPGKPGEETPGKPGEETPVKPGEETPVKPGEETPGKPGEETPGAPTPPQPGQPTPPQPGAPTPPQPGQPTPPQPGAPTPPQPGQPTPPQPGAPTPSQPGKPVATPPAKSVEPTSGQPTQAKDAMLPNTGVDSSIGLTALGLLALAASSFAATRKRKEQ